MTDRHTDLRRLAHLQTTFAKRLTDSADPVTARPIVAPVPAPDHRGMPLAGRLLILVSVVALPLLCLGAGALWEQYQSQHHSAEAQLVQQARSMALLVDREFERAQVVAQTLASAASEAMDNLDTLDGALRAARDLLSAGLPPAAPLPIVSLVDAQGHRLLLTAWKPGERRSGQQATPIALAAMREGRPAVSNLFIAPSSGVPLVGLAVPVFASSPNADGRREVIGGVGISVPRERLIRLVEDVGLPTGAVVSVLDRSGVIVARSLRDGETVGKLPSPVVLQAVLAALSGSLPSGTMTLEQIPSVIAFAHAPSSGYVLKIDVPDQIFLAPLRASLIRSTTVGLLVLLLGLSLAILTASRIVKAFHLALSAAAKGNPALTIRTSTGLKEADAFAAVLAATFAEREQATQNARVLIDNSPIGIIVFDLAGRVHGANDAFLSMVGRTQADLLSPGFTWQTMTPPAWVACDEAAFAETLATGRCTGYEKEYQRPDGIRVPVLVSFSLTDPGRGMAAAFVINLTAQRAAEAARRESETWFRAVTDTMPQIVWSSRPDGSHDYFNQRWYELTGTAAGQTDGEGWNGVFHPDDQERARVRWRRSLASGEPYEIEYRLRMADGTYRWMLGRALPVHDDATGQIQRWFGTCTDIDDVVAAREMLTRSREDLERLVADRSRDLQAIQMRLAQAERLQALGQLAGGIAHDFNNVLHAILGGGALLERRPEDSQAVRRHARMILDTAERGTAVTSRLLAFSRQGDLRAEPLDPVALHRGMADILSHTLGDGVQVHVELAPDLPWLLADKGQLETVLINLATNGRDAMSGIGVLTLAAASEVVRPDQVSNHPGGVRDGRYVRISVSDTGTGMDPQTLAHASEPFFTTKPTGKGTGLGLAMARGFAEQSGGGLFIVSAPGRGTTVTLWFPIAPGCLPATVDTPEPTALVATHQTQARLLLVDDDAAIRDVTTELMQASGFVVLAAASAAAALALLDGGEEVSLIISDLSMPDMDGLSLIREVQHRKPGLPAILLTGFATNAADLAIDGAVSGTFSLLRKPVHGRHLADRVAMLLEAR